VGLWFLLNELVRGSCSSKVTLLFVDSVVVVVVVVVDVVVTIISSLAAGV